ncbi:MAG: methionyl-tRNA formyltransferase, partial [Anaerolineae bacterium]
GMTARVVFMGTPSFAVPSLKQLAERHDVVAVVTVRDRPAGRGRRVRASPAKEAALAGGIAVLQPDSFREQSEVERIRALEPDIIVVAAYGKILPGSVLEIPPQGTVNVHPSLLPRHRGASPVASSILAGDPETGVTLILMDEGMDTGPILAQRSMAIRESDTRGTLTDRLASLGADLLGETLPVWLSGQLEARPQDESQATYTERLAKGDGKIDWRRKAAAIARQVRAYHPWPGAFTHWGGRQVKILAARAAAGGGEPGKVMEAEGGAAIVAGDGRLALEEVQLEGRRSMNIAQFLRGHPGFLGARLGDSHG